MAGHPLINGILFVRVACLVNKRILHRHPRYGAYPPFRHIHIIGSVCRQSRPFLAPGFHGVHIGVTRCDFISGKSGVFAERRSSCRRGIKSQRRRENQIKPMELIRAGAYRLCGVEEVDHFDHWAKIYDTHGPIHEYGLSKDEIQKRHRERSPRMISSMKYFTLSHKNFYIYNSMNYLCGWFAFDSGPCGSEFGNGNRSYRTHLVSLIWGADSCDVDMINLLCALLRAHRKYDVVILGIRCTYCNIKVVSDMVLAMAAAGIGTVTYKIKGSVGKAYLRLVFGAERVYD